MNTLITALAFIFSTGSIIFLIYFQIKIVYLQQILLFLIVLLIFLSRKFKLNQKKGILDWFLLLIVTFFIQLLVTSTGSILSPFLVLIHLYIIGLSLLFDFKTAFIFLISEIILFGFNIKFDPNLLKLIKGDLGSVFIYASSFLVITPISKVIAAQYHIKADTLSDIFNKLKAEESIIGQIDDFVVTTDMHLNIITANESAQKIINSSKEFNNLTEAINLVDQKDVRISQQTLALSLAPIIHNLSQSKTSNQLPDEVNTMRLIIDDYFLKLPNKKTSMPVLIKVTPLLNQNGQLEKFTFLIAQTYSKNNLGALNMKLQETQKSYQSIISSLKKDLLISQNLKTNFFVEMLERYEADILIASSLTFYSSVLKFKICDIMAIFHQIIEDNQKISQKFETEVKLNFDEQMREKYESQKQKVQFPDYLRDMSSLSLVTDPRLVSILMEKILLSMIVLAHITKSNLVEVELDSVNGTIQFITKIKIAEGDEKISQLLDINNNNFEIMDHLPLSSGLESHIISSISNLINSTITTDYNKYNTTLSLKVILINHQ